MPSNYPPGVTGCEPQVGGYDEWEALYEWIDDVTAEHNISAEEIREKIQELITWKEREKELKSYLKFICDQLDDLAESGAYKSKEYCNTGIKGRLERQYDRLLDSAGKIEKELGL